LISACVFTTSLPDFAGSFIVVYLPSGRIWQKVSAAIILNSFVSLIFCSIIFFSQFSISSSPL